MEVYQSLQKLYYQKVNIDQELEKRLDNPCVQKLNLEIFPILKGERKNNQIFKLFYLPIPQIIALQEEIIRNSKKIKEVSSKLSSTTYKEYIYEIMINEIEKSNGIEGISSTKEELYESITKQNRFSGIVNKYIKIINEDVELIETPQQIRMLYDEVFEMDILKNPSNQLDGELFRKESIHISDGFKKVHTGDSSEKMILAHLEQLIAFMNRKDLPALIKACVVHYYFEYIHPFYDGNGRFGRLLFSMYLAKEIDVFTAISLSNAIFENKEKYFKLFTETSNIRNCGEVTFFILGMMELIKKGQESILNGK